MSLMAVKYFSSSFSGFVSSYLKKQIPLFAYKNNQDYGTNLHKRGLNSLCKMIKNNSYLCITKIEVNSFGVADVKDTVGLRRKTSTYLKGIQKWEGEDKYDHFR